MTEITEAEIQIEKDIEEAAKAVSALVEDTFTDDDGAGHYVYKALPKEGDDEFHLIAFIPLEEGPEARWTIHINFGVEVIESDFTINTPATEVAGWLAKVIAEQK